MKKILEFKWQKNTKLNICEKLMQEVKNEYDDDYDIGEIKKIIEKFREFRSKLIEEQV